MSVVTKVGKITPLRTAFFVCDIQERLKETIGAYTHVVNTATKMVRAAELLKVPVVITEQKPSVFKATAPEIETRFSALASDLKLGPFPKTKFGMLIPEVESFLKERDIQSVVLFGVETHICVLQTALDLLETGKDVHVLADGVSSANPEEVAWALARMRQAGAHVTTSESLLYQLMGDASAPAFRAFAGLMKETKDDTTAALRSLQAKPSL